ncbi:MAG: hypothetical protein ACREMN_02880 [Gemmatimonadales bacterium]
MHWTTKTAVLALAFVQLVGCRDATVAPAPEPALSLAGDMQVERPRVDVTTWEDQTTTIPLDVVTPEAASNIGPGSAIVITIPDEGRFGCTANFVWSAGGRRYLGAAGHCFLPTDRAATHGPGADYDASGVVVQVCVEDCEGNFRTNLLVGTWVTLGKVAYARQTFAGEDVGNDFGIVEIPKQVRDLIRLELPVWGGPNGVETLETGDYACHYGHGLGVGEVFPTKARIGVGGGSDDDAWMGDFAGSFGDSGSPLVGCVNDGVGSFEGTGAIGVLTHLGVGFDESSVEHGVIFGTTTARAIEMAREAGLRLSLVLP